MKFLTTFFLLLVGSGFAAINAVNGVTASTSSNINGVTTPSAVNGQTLVSGGGGPTRIANTIAGATIADTGTVTTPGIDTTGANLIVISASSWTATTAEVTITDSKGNTWTGLTGLTGGNARNRLYYCVSPTVGSGHTFTATGLATFPTIAVEAWSGMTTPSPFDQQSGANSAGATSLNTNNITAAQANTVYFAGTTFVSSRSLSSVSNGFTIGNSLADLSGNHLGGGIAYKQLSAIAADSTTFTFSGSTPCAVRMANFKY